MSTDDWTPGQVLAAEYPGLLWRLMGDEHKQVFEQRASAVLRHHASTHQPRVWRSGDPEPGEDVRVLMDRHGLLWERKPFGAWHHSWSGDTWAVVVDEYGPLVEVVLPQPVTE